HAQIARCAFGLLDELAPFANQILLLLSGEACLLLEALELVARVTQRLGAELGHGTVVRDRAEQFADDSPQALDFLARLLDVGHAVYRFGAVLDLLLEFREGVLELVDLPGEFLDRRDGIVFGGDGRERADADEQRARNERREAPHENLPGRHPPMCSIGQVEIASQTRGSSDHVPVPPLSTPAQRERPTALSAIG